MTCLKTLNNLVK